MTIAIRPARKEDVPQIYRMVLGLAEFVNEVHRLRATEASLLADGFGERPQFHCLVADAGGGRLVGCVIYTRNYSTWQGNSVVYIDDLFVTEEARGTGIGKKLVAHVAKEAIIGESGRISLTVLDWNPARKAYETMGFEHEQTSLRYTVEGAALRSLAALAD